MTTSPLTTMRQLPPANRPRPPNLQIQSTKSMHRRKKSPRKFRPSRTDFASETQRNRTAITTLNYDFRSPILKNARVKTSWYAPILKSPDLFWEQDHNQIALKTKDENKHISEKMREYSNYHKPFAETVSTFEYTVSHADMKDRFHDLASKINSMLATENSLMQLEPFVKDCVSLGPGLSYYYSLPAKMKLVPLKIHIMITQGVGFAEVYISQRIPRPNIHNCDKDFKLDKKDIFTTFYGSQENDQVFVYDNLFLTIKAERELSVVFEYCYGKSIFLIDLIIKKATQFVKKQSESEKQKFDQPISKVPSKIMIERQIALLIRDPKSFEDLNNRAFLIKKRRRDKYMRLSGNIDYVDKNKESLMPVRSTSREIFERKRIQTLTNREQREDEEIKRKFVFIHSKEINKVYVFLVFRNL